MGWGESSNSIDLPVYCFVEGRRPAGLALPTSTASATVLGDYFARGAYLEAASAVAFGRLARELAAHGAPGDLVARCQRARAAELRHARSLGQLALRFAVRPVAPSAQTVRVRPLVDIALENVVEGCVRQMFGAAVARFRANSAEDLQIRRIMGEIAGDAYEQAELAFAVATWLQGQIDPIEGAWVENAMRHAVVALVGELDIEVSPELCARAGVPGRQDALAIWSGLSKRVWHGQAELVWSSATAAA